MMIKTRERVIDSMLGMALSIERVVLRRANYRAKSSFHFSNRRLGTLVAVKASVVGIVALVVIVQFATAEQLYIFIVVIV